MTRACDRDRAGEGGFSLIEVLVALLIIAAMTGVFFEAVAQNATTQRAVRARSSALMVAQSRLDSAVAGDEARAGRAGELAWRVDRSRYGDGDAFDRHPLEQLAVTVSGTDGKPLLTLSTVRIIP